MPKTQRVGLCSYPKSGNTWVRFMIANIMAANRTVDYRNIDDLIPTGVPTIKAPEAKLSGWEFYKSHLPIEQAIKIYDRVIYISRNGFDALESYRWFLQKQHPSLFRSDIDFMLGHMRFYGYWGEHYNVKFDSSDRVHVLRYEDLKADSHTELRLVMEFLGLDAKEQREVLEMAISKSTKERMRSLPGSAEFMKAANGDTNFVRRGESGKGQRYWEDAGFLSRIIAQPGFKSSMKRFTYPCPTSSGDTRDIGVREVLSFYSRDFTRKARKALQ